MFIIKNNLSMLLNFTIILNILNAMNKDELKDESSWNYCVELNYDIKSYHKNLVQHLLNEVFRKKEATIYLKKTADIAKISSDFMFMIDKNNNNLTLSKLFKNFIKNQNESYFLIIDQCNEEKINISKNFYLYCFCNRYLNFVENSSFYVSYESVVYSFKIMSDELFSLFDSKNSFFLLKNLIYKLFNDMTNLCNMIYLDKSKSEILNSSNQIFFELESFKTDLINMIFELYLANKIDKSTVIKYYILYEMCIENTKVLSEFYSETPDVIKFDQSFFNLSAMRLICLMDPHILNIYDNINDIVQYYIKNNDYSKVYFLDSYVSSSNDFLYKNSKMDFIEKKLFDFLDDNINN